MAKNKKAKNQITVLFAVMYCHYGFAEPNFDDGWDADIVGASLSIEGAKKLVTAHHMEWNTDNISVTELRFKTPKKKNRLPADTVLIGEKRDIEYNDDDTVDKKATAKNSWDGSYAIVKTMLV